MRLFPSTSAAIVGGAVVAPLSLFGMSLSEWAFGVRSPMFVWVLVGIGPMVLTTTDLRPLRDWRFGPLWVANANRADRMPWCKRMALYLASNFVSLLILQYLGVSL